ncbi:type VI secretion system contractile sheath large subunit [Mesorhizobium sp. 1B3]|uniref:type VI secretion system contractile sheath large subunit n=1 Tax=Mesorhizobium sp. 1B3 TaxID=3243599 RepID=UPI003D97D610
MDDLDLIAAETNLRDAQPASQAGLRMSLVEAVLGGDNDAARALDAFLAEDRPAHALRAWLGSSGAGGAVARAMMTRDIAAIDTLMGDQLDTILHHPDVQRVESAWRGVELLLDTAHGDDRVRVRIFNATWQELARDFDRSIEFDQSALFAKVYSEEYGMPGGVPYGLLLCDYAVRHKRAGHPPTDDVSALAGLSQVAAAAFSPCIIGAAPDLLGVSSFADLSYVQRLDAGFRLAEYQRWQKLREQEDSRFLGVVMPRILMREPYGIDSAREDGFLYREGSGDLGSWLWGNAVYAFGAVAIRTFRESGWFADIKGARIGDAENEPRLSMPPFSTGEEIAFRRPLEVELTDKKQKALEELGFVSFSPAAFTRSIVLLGAQSLHAAPAAADTAEKANARLSSMLQYVLCVSRFAHYVKVMARDRVGRFTTPAALETMLGDWLRNYTIGNADAGPELKARYPLNSASVEVREVPGRPGIMSCTLQLQPHFQFDQMVTGLKLRTNLEPGAGR